MVAGYHCQDQDSLPSVPNSQVIYPKNCKLLTITLFALII